MGREASAGEVQDAPAGGASVEEVRRGVAGSAEAAARLSGVFEAVLGRVPAGTAEGTGWMQEVLARGGSVSEVRAGLAHSDEAAGAIRGAYLQTLGRDAEAAGVSYWRERLAGGLSLSEVRAALAASPEAASRVSAPAVEAPGGAGEAAPAPEGASGSAADGAPASGGATGADSGAQTPPGAAVAAGTLGAAALDGVIRIAPSAGEGGLLTSLGAGLGRVFRVVGWGAVAAVVLTPGSANPADRGGTGSGGGGPLSYRAGETRVDLTWAPDGTRLSYGAGGVLRAEDGTAGGVSLTYDRTDGTLRTAGGRAVGRLDDTGLSVDEAWLTGAKAGDIERLVPPVLPDMQDPGYTPGTSPPPSAGTSATPDSATPDEGGFTPAPVLPDVEQGPSADGPEGPQIVESQGDPGSTRPTGPVNGVPTGPRSTTAEGASPKDKAQVDSENQVADAFATAGYRVVQNPTQGANPALTPERMRVEGLNPSKDPDLLIEDRVFDTYTPDKDEAGSIRNGIARKIDDGQTHRVVVDLRNTTQTEVSVRAALRAEPIPGLKEVVVLTETGLGRPFRP